VKNFLANEWDRTRTLKRGGRHVTVSLDVVKAERWYVPSLVDAESPEVLFERRWALSVLEQAMLRLRSDFASARESDLFTDLSVFLSQDASEVRYAELAGQLGVRPGTLRTRVYRMREKYQQLLREEISETVSTVAEIDDEIRFLVSRLIE
jgi:DNA-directed RNA polymerase specialized sigma24 family protein